MCKEGNRQSNKQSNKQSYNQELQSRVTVKIASGSADRTIKLWDKNSGNLLRTLTSHDDGVLSVSFDSIYLLASGSADKTIKLWGV